MLGGCRRFVFRSFISFSLILSLSGVALPESDSSADTISNPPVDNEFGDGGTSAFYQPTSPVPTEPGTMLRTEPLDPSHLVSAAGDGFRILYSSRSGIGEADPIEVSGEVLFPKGSPPVGGWPVIAWDHGTTGVADVCAPSWRGYLKRDLAYLNSWLSEGFVVVATDYQGLGTPGPHPYLLFRPEAYSTMDAVRAVLQEYNSKVRNQIIIVGQSQGSGAALGTAWLSPTYAPYLKILGVVATGLVVDFKAKSGTEHPPIPVNYDDSGTIEAAYEMLMLEGTYQSLRPTVNAQSVMTSKGIALSHIARSECLGDLFKATKAGNLSTSDLFTVGLQQYEAGSEKDLVIPDGLIKVPVFAGTGLADYEASIPSQYNAVAAMCDAGTAVTWVKYSGLTHNGALNGSLKDSIPFVRALIAGKPEPTNCSSITVPGPLQNPTPSIPFNN